MRAALLALTLVAACVGTRDQLAGVPDDAGGAANAQCVTAADCMLAASSCCACPAFAAPRTGDACSDVMCPTPPTDCPQITAACVDGACTIACQPVRCDLSCPQGFASDAAGCLVCACAMSPEPQNACAVDADCAEIPADCCGCARGGADEAVLASQADAIVASRMCPPSPSCPDVDVCTPGAAARCLGGQCALVAPPPTTAGGECGRADEPPCPSGTVCVLNADPRATSDRAGTCQPAN